MDFTCKRWYQGRNHVNTIMFFCTLSVVIKNFNNQNTERGIASHKINEHTQRLTYDC